MRKPRSLSSRMPKSVAALRRYHAKRNLAVSGEPAGSSRVKATGQGGRFRFVIQKHDASRLHYDLRLEMDGVYKSWAVPKGLPLKPGEKSLAVEVEDHPLDYGDFEGTIPAGNYGAGTVMLWDRGLYTVDSGPPIGALRRGKVHFRLEGEKCSGEWTLVRMKTTDADRANWLVIRNSGGAKTTAIKTQGRDVSVKTGRSLQEIADGAAAKNRRAPTAKTAKRVPAAAPAAVATAAGKSRQTRGSKKNAAALRFIEPMKVLGVGAVPAGDWLLEVKFDGFRALALVENGRADLWSRNEKLLSSDYPSLVEALSRLSCRSAIVDGEIVALDENGKPTFQLLQNARRGVVRAPLFFYAFDLLHLDGRSLLNEPIEQRKAALAALLSDAPEAIKLSPVFRKAPAEFLSEMRRKGFEGLVAKTPHSLYEPGRRSGTWIKCRISHEQEFVIGGFTPPGGSRSHFGAILVGYYEGKELLFAGKVGTGFDGKSLKSLHAMFTKHAQTECPFANLPRPRSSRFGQGMSASAMREVTWLEPRFVAQIKFSEWTRDGLLRQPVFLGLREDKDARDVTREPVAD